MSEEGILILRALEAIAIAQEEQTKLLRGILHELKDITYILEPKYFRADSIEFSALRASA